MKKTILILIWLVVNSSLCSYLWAQDYLIGPDDILKISVSGHSDLDKTVRVSADGYISFSLLGKIKAGGFTIPELERNMNRELIGYFKKPQVSVVIQEYNTVTLSGQVEKPGVYPLKKEISLIEIISIAGGFTKSAAQNAVRLIRLENGKKKTIVVRVAQISKKGDQSQDLSLKRGDIVFVPKSLF